MPRRAVFSWRAWTFCALVVAAVLIIAHPGVAQPSIQQQISDTYRQAAGLINAAGPGSPLERQLAAADAGLVPVDDTTVARFHYLLGALSTATGDTQQYIADATLGAQKTLREKYGKDVKLLAIMERANRDMIASPGVRSYDDVMVVVIAGLGR